MERFSYPMVKMVRGCDMRPSDLPRLPAANVGAILSVRQETVGFLAHLPPGSADLESTTASTLVKSRLCLFRADGCKWS
jgi:hypothetical protein